MTIKKSKIFLIYTGGTIGMIQDPKTASLKPFNLKHLLKYIPELFRLDVEFSTHSFAKPIDSSNMTPAIWIELAELIEKNYDTHDGFVILHGSDTMAYTASALSFLLENIAKPVILTGSQLPIGVIRTDGKENLITAIEIAASKNVKGQAIIPEVAIYFEYRLLRGNRAVKYNALHFNAFASPNYPVLAEAGLDIQFHYPFIKSVPTKPLKVHKNLDNDIAVLTLYPGISKKSVDAILHSDAKAIVLKTFGSGNASTDKWFIDALQQAISKGKIIVNITQCMEGEVLQGKYDTSIQLEKIGVISGGDMTQEAVVTKLMFLLGQKITLAKIKQQLVVDSRGELS